MATKAFQGARDILANGPLAAKVDFLVGLSLIFDALAKALAAVLPIEATSDDFEALCAAAGEFEQRWNMRKAAAGMERALRGQPALSATMGDGAVLSLTLALDAQRSLRADRSVEHRLDAALSFLHLLLASAGNGLIDETPELAAWFVEGLARVAMHRSTTTEDGVQSVSDVAGMWVEDIVLEIHQNRARILADEPVARDASH